MPWSLKFDEPIALATGKSLRTLRDAGRHVLALPADEAALPHWQLAAECLLAAAEQGGSVMMARIAVVKALGAAAASEPIPPRKRAVKKYRIIK